MNTLIMAHTVLLVDDDPHIREVLSFAFDKAGMTTHQAQDGEEALEKVARTAPDLVVLDINMPRMNGLDVCRKLRGESDVPILFLSSRDEEIDRVLGIEMGGDDYVTKPFSPREVVARASAILRRSASQSKPVAGDDAPIRCGDLLVSPQGWSAQFRRREVELTATEFTLLKTLVTAPSRVFSRDQLIDHLHGPGFAITDRTIDSHIRNVRRKFAEAGCADLIETKAGVGYRMGSCVE